MDTLCPPGRTGSSRWTPSTPRVAPSGSSAASVPGDRSPSGSWSGCGWAGGEVTGTAPVRGAPRRACAAWTAEVRPLAGPRREPASGRGGPSSGGEADGVPRPPCGPRGLTPTDQRQGGLGDRGLDGGDVLLRGLLHGGRGQVVVRVTGPGAAADTGEGDRTDRVTAGLAQPHLQAHLGEQVGELDVEGVADGGEQLGGGFLLATLDLGEVPQADPCRARDVPQRALLPQPVAPQGVPQLGAQQRHGHLLSTPTSRSNEQRRRPGRPEDAVCSPYAAVTMATVRAEPRPLMGYPPGHRVPPPRPAGARRAGPAAAAAPPRPPRRGSPPG